jgi:small conductance mechanosensitive channel
MSQFSTSRLCRALKLTSLFLLSTLLIHLWSAPAHGQLFNIPDLLRQTPSVYVRRSGNIEVARVRLDGRPLFQVAALQSVDAETLDDPIDWRVREIEFNLKNLVQGGFDPNTLRVSLDKRNGLTVLQATHADLDQPRVLLTVTQLDAAIDPFAQTVEEAAQRRRSVLERALKRALLERQPDYMYRQLANSILILGALGLGIGILLILDRWRRRSHFLSPGATEAAPVDSATTTDALSDDAILVEETDPLAQFPPNRLKLPPLGLQARKSLNRTLRFLIRVSIAIIFWVGTTWILSRFPQTRPLARWLLRAPTAIVLIPVIATAVKGIVDGLILVIIHRTQAILKEQHPLDQRTQIRAQTFYRVLQDLTLAIVCLIGSFAFFEIINAQSLWFLLLAVVGFASQNLIKDWLQGAMILLEDHYATGDIVKVGDMAGIVEFMNLRVTQVRTLDGELVSINNGAITQPINLTRHWSRVNLAIAVAYSTDLDKAMAVIEQVATEMQHDPVWGEHILADPQVLGVDDFQESGITIRLLMKTQPAKHWDVGREYRRRLKAAFDQAGITIPLPQRSIWLKTPLQASN